jgi:preprotein translocase subunit SecD
MKLKYRVGVILALIALSIFELFPRTVTKRVQDGKGGFVTQQKREVPLKQGLDLQGGMHLALDIDESKGVVADRAEAIDRALKVVRTRTDELGVSEPVVQKVGTDRIVVDLPGIDDPERARDIMQRSAFLQFQIVDKTQALDRVLPRLDAIVKEKGLVASTGTSATAGAVTVPAAGSATSLFTPKADSGAKRDSTKKDSTGADSALATLPGAKDGPFSTYLQSAGAIGQYVVPAEHVEEIRNLLERPEIQNALPPAKVVRWGSDSIVAGGKTYRALYVLDQRPILTGEYLTKAEPRSDPVDGTLVTFELNREGGRRFASETGKHIRDYLATVLDDRVVSAPAVIQSQIGTRGQITMGGRDLQSAQDFALVLRAGSLPVPLKVAEMRNIGPSLGQDSINKAKTAGIIAIALIVVILLAYYRFSGMLAVGGLVLYVLYTLAVLAGFDAVLTLPGLAGFILSIGIAVDANVLIFERIREELALGKTVRTSIDEGFRHAMSAIIDSNVSTVLTAAVLYQFGTGPVKGFAVTLIAGIVASMITSIFVVRTFYLIWLDRSRGAQTLSI